MKKIKNIIISLLISPLPLSIILGTYNLLLKGIWQAQASIIFFVLFSYIIELIFILPVLIKLKNIPSYKKTAITGCLIGLILSVIIFIPNMVIHKYNWKDYLFLLDINMLINGLLAGFIISSCFWLTNNFLNKRLKNN